LDLSLLLRLLVFGLELGTADGNVNEASNPEAQ
jgi:hypothetical protein